MKEKDRPIYYCTHLEYTPLSCGGMGLEDYEGETNEDLSYHFHEIKYGQEILKSEMHNEPYFPAVIEEYERNPEDYLNVFHSGDTYEADFSISLETYQNAYKQMVDHGILPGDINATSLHDYVMENKVEKRAI
jgi:hypothetical protein